MERISKYLKRTLSLVLALVMTLTFGMPKTNVMASRNGRATNYSFDGVEVEESFKKQKMSDIFDSLVVPSSMAHLAIINSSGVVTFSGKKAAFESGKIFIDKEFDFGTDTVGRFSIDAYRTSGKPIAVSFYLDDETEPFTTIDIRKQPSSSASSAHPGTETSKIVMTKNITGKHNIYFSFSTDSKETEVTFNSFEFVKNSLPVVSFDIDESEGTVEDMNNSENHTDMCHGSMNIDIPSGYEGEYSDSLASATYKMEYIRGRGNSTWSESKKPYKIKLESKADILGMGSNKHWVLIANIYDNSKMRNKMTYTLGERLGIAYTPKSVPVDVVMNGEYYGNYYLSEQIRVGKNRVDIPNLEEEDHKLSDEEITGGYLLNLDGDPEGMNYFETSNEVGIGMECPAFEDYMNGETDFQEVKDYISDYVQRTEDAMVSKEHINSKGEKLEDLLNIDDSLAYYMIQEISQNGDGFGTGSTYFFKDRNKKFTYGPLWDFDYVAWAGCEYDIEEPYSFLQNSFIWNAGLLQTDEMVAKAKTIFEEQKAVLSDMVKDGGYIDELYSSLTASMYYDIEKWGFYNHGTDEDYEYSFIKERERLKNWVKGKLEWMEENFDDIKSKTYKITFSVDGKLVSKQEIFTSQNKITFPETPSKDGYIFTGWFVMTEDGVEEKFDENSFVDQDLDIYAKFIKSSEAIMPKDILCRTNDVYVKIGDGTYLPNYKILPEDTTYPNAEILSSDESVAKKNNDSIDLLKEGVTTITLKTQNGLAKSFKLHVVSDDYDEIASAIVAEEGQIKLNVGGYRLLNYTPDPEDGVMEEQVNYTSADGLVASVDEYGIIEANSPGTTYIAVEYKSAVQLVQVIVNDSNKKGKGDLSILGDFLTEMGKPKYSIIMRGGGAKPLLLVAQSLKKNKYAKKANIYTVKNGKVVRVGKVTSKKNYLSIKSGKIICKASKKTVKYWKIKNSALTGFKYVKKKKKFFRYTYKSGKWKKKKKISKKKGKAYIKAKNAKSIVFATM